LKKGNSSYGPKRDTEGREGRLAVFSRKHAILYGTSRTCSKGYAQRGRSEKNGGEEEEERKLIAMATNIWGEDLRP